MLFLLCHNHESQKATSFSNNQDSINVFNAKNKHSETQQSLC